MKQKILNLEDNLNAKIPLEIYSEVQSKIEKHFDNLDAYIHIPSKKIFEKVVSIRPDIELKNLNIQEEDFLF